MDLQSQDGKFYHDSRLSLSLSSRLILMISLVGVIGTGLFLRYVCFAVVMHYLRVTQSVYKKVTTIYLCETYLVSVKYILYID